MSYPQRLNLQATVILGFIILQPLRADAAVGRTVGQSNVSYAGEATYSIPIKLPPGISGLTPQLALIYGHRQDEDLAGVGWGISGLSAISRCAKTWAQDGAPANVELEISDRFCYSGSQLKLKSGTYGGNGSEYRTEVDMMARFTAHGTAGNGPEWFEVEERNGLIYEYGNSINSRIESLAAGWTDTVLYWALYKIKDRQGNEIVFDYTEDGPPYGDYRINYITYRENPGQAVLDGYSVNFEYQPQPAGDVDTQSAAGGTIEDVERLESIDVWYTFPAINQLVRRYKLSYEDALSSTGRSRLETVEECAGSPVVCLEPITFTYQDGIENFEAEVSSGTTIPAGVQALPIDINGDGRTDLAYSSSAGSGTGNWYYRLAKTNGQYDEFVDSGILNTKHPEAIAFDYDSDGLEDILVPNDGGTWSVIYGSTAGLVSPAVDTEAPDESRGGNAIALDMNGDGREDLVWGERIGGSPGNESKIMVRYRLAAGGFDTEATALFANGGHIQGPKLFNGFYRQSRTSHFDVNGDGLRDVAFLVKNGIHPNFVEYTYVLLGGGGLFLVNAINSSGLPIDINGDGYTDIAFSDGFGNVKLRLSTGKSFSPEVTGPSLADLDFGKSLARDWNSDGFQDLLIPNTSTGKWHYMLSDGETLAAAVATQIDTYSPSAVFPIDANGDGLDDIGYVRSNGVYAHRIHSGIKPDLMKTATDGYDNTITFNYTSIVQGSYTKYTSWSFPNQSYIGPLSVVSSAVPSTGIDSDTYTLTYSYKGAVLNLEGRGLSPFSMMTTQDSRNGVKVVDTFHRFFPYRGRLFKRQLKQSDDKLIQELAYTRKTKSGGSGNEKYEYPYLQKLVEKNYEVGGAFNGNQINDVTTTNVVDAYGTPTSITKVTTEKATANGVQSGAVFTEQVTNTNITNNLTTWCLGRPGQTQSVNSHNQTYGGQITRTVSRVWDTSTYCRLTQETIEPASATYKVIRNIGYDNFGNVDTDTITGIGMVARTKSSNFGTEGHLPQSVTNALGQVTTMTWDYANGVPSSQTDPNGLVVSWQYDDFGRRTRETNVDGTYTDYSLTECSAANSYCGTSYNRVRTKMRASSKDIFGTEIRFSDTFLDKVDRQIQTETQLMSGAISMQRTGYDSMGRVKEQSTPQFSATPSYQITTDYDDLNRPTQLYRPIDATHPTLQYTTFDYEGLTTTITDPEGKTSKKIADALGRVHRSADHSGHYQQFDYDAFGSIRRVIDNSSPSNTLQEIAYAYGLGAFRVSSDDMDMGAWTYTPNALGEVVAYTDGFTPVPQEFSATFDKLGRPLTRTEPDNKTIWTWGTSPAAHNIGRLASVCVTDLQVCSTGHSESYGYDSNGRLEHRTVVADTTYAIDYAYDPTTGQLDALTYPETTASYRLKLKYDYAYGFLEKVSDFNVPATEFWVANSIDARANVVHETLGNGLESVRGFDDVTGRLDYIQTGPGGGLTRQNMDYSWNKVGSLTQRKDLNRNLTEDFYYDDMHRLDYSNLNTVQNLDLSYDSMGNITYKSDVSASNWVYHADKKHAVITAGSNTYVYDDNGNMKTRNGDPITWSSYNYPTKIVDGIRTNEFSYDANRQKWKHKYTINSSVETTYFVGGIFEKNVHSGGTDYRHYINANGKAVAMLTRVNTVNTVRYLTYDHMGSIDEISNANGSTHVNESFSAFGERRDPTDWSGNPPSADIYTIAVTTDRGYTGHLNLINTSLIHMNGRVADAETGRFLSADPYIPDPGQTQSFNRYSYVHNNPLTYTDPTGHCIGIDLVCFSAVASILNFAFGGLFGGSSGPPPPTGCLIIGGAVQCYGAASSSKLYNIINDIIKLAELVKNPWSLVGTWSLGGSIGGGGFGNCFVASCGGEWDGITLNHGDDISQPGQPIDHGGIFGQAVFVLLERERMRQERARSNARFEKIARENDDVDHGVGVQDAATVFIHNLLNLNGVLTGTAAWGHGVSGDFGMEVDGESATGRIAHTTGGGLFAGILIEGKTVSFGSLDGYNQAATFSIGTPWAVRFSAQWGPRGFQLTSAFGVGMGAEATIISNGYTSSIEKEK